MLSQLKKKMIDRSATIGVVGLGYVGLPLALAFARSGFRTIGFDIDQFKVDAINSARSYIRHIPAEQVREQLELGRLKATRDFTLVSNVDALILCVPTPLNAHFEPDLTYVTDTLDSVVPHLRSGQIISLESTTYPGTTDEEVVPRITKRGLQVGTEVFVVYSPEREDPGNPEFASTNIPKVVGGTSINCIEAGVALYGAAFDQIVPVSSTKVAELTKLLENIYRAVNIGLVNELKIVADRMGIDIWEVIAAASTKPFGFKPFYPGPGLGGHCIPIDPFYLTWKAREYGVQTRFIELAGQVNRSMPDYVIQRTMMALNQRGKAVKGSRVLLLGLAYKSNVDDMRESPTFALMDALSGLGATVAYYDPFIPEIGPTREHASWQGICSVSWNQESISSYDCVIIATHHKAIALKELAQWASLIIDTRNAMHGIECRSGQVMKA